MGHLGHLENLVAQMEEHLAYMEQEEIPLPEPVLSPVSTRISNIQLQYLDMLAERYGNTRASMARELLESAIMDVMQQIGLTKEFCKRLRPANELIEGGE